MSRKTRLDGWMTRAKCLHGMATTADDTCIQLTSTFPNIKGRGSFHDSTTLPPSMLLTNKRPLLVKRNIFYFRKSASKRLPETKSHIPACTPAPALRSPSELVFPPQTCSKLSLERGASIYDVHTSFGFFDPLSIYQIHTVCPQTLVYFLPPCSPSVRTYIMEASKEKEAASTESISLGMRHSKNAAHLTSLETTTTTTCWSSRPGLRMIGGPMVSVA